MTLVHYELVCFLSLYIFSFASAGNCSSILYLDRVVSTMMLYERDIHINLDLILACAVNTTHLVVNQSKSLSSGRFLDASSFIASHFPNLSELRFFVDPLYYINGNAWLNSSHSITSISLSQCGISSLPLFRSFYFLPNLVSLDLSGNTLTYLPHDLLLYLPKLKFLDLSNNRLIYLPSLYPSYKSFSYVTVSITGNKLACDCANSHLRSDINYINISYICPNLPPPCNDTVTVKIHSLNENNLTDTVDALAGDSFHLICNGSSSLPLHFAWISPIGLLPDFGFYNFSDYGAYNFSYFTQPLIASTLISIEGSNTHENRLTITNMRGHLGGDWFCLAISPTSLALSSVLRVNVTSSLYNLHIYFISLIYGFGTAFILLLFGIIGGSIRYCIDTNCFRKPAPPYNYRGKPIIGVIPVPQLDDDDEYIEEDTLKKIVHSSPFIEMLNNGPTNALESNFRIFCPSCKTDHVISEIVQLRQKPLSQASDTFSRDNLISSQTSFKDLTYMQKRPLLFSSMDNYKGDALKLAPRQQSVLEAIYEDASNTESCGDQLEQYCSLEVISDSGTAEKADEGPIDMTGLFRQEKCILTTLSNFDPLEDEYSSLAATLINYRLPRNGRANIKLVVSDQRLAEEYSSALADLAKAAEGPDMVHFRERLEDFRARLRRDVGRSVKVARGEWEAWRAKSARSVATLRNQSSAAAQKMRAGLSHGVEQMKDGMRSMAELCGATGTIGQTISVVSVYVDEADQIKKERVISDFVF